MIWACAGSMIGRIGGCMDYMRKSFGAAVLRLLATSLVLALLPVGFGGCGFMPGGYYYEQMHAHDPGIHGWGTWGFGDVNGEVGHRFYHSVLRLDCEPSNHWSRDPLRLVSGSLPPGLSINDEGGWDIVGIPEERGHWIARIAVSGVQCNGRNYSSFDTEGEIRFHISGTGKVIE